MAARRRRAWAAALLALVGVTPTSAAPAPRLLAGAASVDIALPEGTPLAGYGGFPRRAWFPDLLDRYPNAFWFRPSQGVHDAVKARALALDDGREGLIWLAVGVIVLAIVTRGFRRQPPEIDYVEADDDEITKSLVH